MQALAVKQDEHRRSLRYKRKGQLLCQYGPEKIMAATLKDVSVDGFCIRLEGYIPAGTNVLLKCGTFLPELKCKVLWCSPLDSDWCYAAGLRIHHTDADVATGVTALVLSAQSDN